MAAAAMTRRRHSRALVLSTLLLVVAWSSAVIDSAAPPVGSYVDGTADTAPQLVVKVALDGVDSDGCGASWAAACLSPLYPLAALVNATAKLADHSIQYTTGDSVNASQVVLPSMPYGITIELAAGTFNLTAPVLLTGNTTVSITGPALAPGLGVVVPPAVEPFNVSAADLPQPTKLNRTVQAVMRCLRIDGGAHPQFATFAPFEVQDSGQLALLRVGVQGCGDSNDPPPAGVIKAGNTSQVAVTQCVLSGNAGDSGALLAIGNAAATLTSTWFEGLSGSAGGAALALGSSSVNFTGCVFDDLRARTGGVVSVSSEGAQAALDSSLSSSLYMRSEEVEAVVATDAAGKALPALPQHSFPYRSEAQCIDDTTAHDPAAGVFRCEPGQVNTVTALQGYLVDGSGPGVPYAPGIRCGWNLVMPADSKVHIRVCYIDIEEYEDCIYDALEVRENVNVERKFCGNTIPEPFVFDSDNFDIIFASDTYDERGGFVVQFWTVQTNTARFGAVVNVDAGAALVSACLLRDSLGRAGGAIMAWDGRVDVIDTTILRSGSKIEGGAMYLLGSAVGTVRRCNISQVVVKDGNGGAFAATANSQLLIVNSTIERCAASGGVGHAIFGWQFPVITLQDVHMVDNGVPVVASSTPNSPFVSVKMYDLAMRFDVKLIMEDVTWDGAMAGVMYAKESVDVKAKRISIHNGGATMAPAAFRLYGDVTSHFEDLEVSGYTAANGAVLQTFQSSVTLLTRPRFTNTAANSGGILTMADSSKLTIEAPIIHNAAYVGSGFVETVLDVCSSHTQRGMMSRATAGSGGVAWVDSSAQLNISNAVITQSSASASGGVIYAMASAEVWVTNTTIMGTTAAEGGVVATAASAHVALTNVTTAFTRADDGGVLAAGDTSTMVMHSCQVGGSEATFTGGAVEVTSLGVVTLVNTRVENASAITGGAVYVGATASAWTGAATGRVKGTSCDSASIAAARDAASASRPRVELVNSTLHAARAVSGGGAIMVSGPGAAATLRGCTISEALLSNVGTGGAALVEVSGRWYMEDTQIINNTATEGGGITASSGAIVAALSSSVSHNTATEAGGGIAVAGEALVMAASTTMVENVGVNGGAVDIQGKAAVAMCSCTVQRNGATMFGGGALVNNGALVMNNTQLTFNVAADGGAVYQMLGADTLLQASNVSHNSVSGSGGALFGFAGTTAVVDSTATGNVAPTGDGGFASLRTNAKLTLTNTVVEEGLAIFGGALYLEGSSSVNTYGGSIRSNVGEVSAGAALLVATSTVALHNTRVEFNHGGSGGVFLSANSATVRMQNCTLDTNTAGLGGIGVVEAQSSFVVEDCIVTKNRADTAGCIFGTGSAAITIAGSSFVKNVARFAAFSYFLQSAKVTISNSSFSGNHASSVGVLGAANGASVRLDRCNMTSNTALGSTGALYAREFARLHVTGGHYKFNTAGSDGGVMTTGGSPQVTLEGAFFDDNTASRGGALYLGASNKAELEHLSLTGNRADKGGALYWPDPAAVPAELCRNCIIHGNVANVYGHEAASGVASLQMLGYSDTHLTEDDQGLRAANTSVYYWKKAPVLAALTLSSALHVPPIAIAAFDAFGQSMVGDTGLQIFISTLTKSTNASIGQETQSGGDAGFAIFDGLQVVGQPGTSAEIIFVASQPVNVPPLVVTVHFAACRRGEVQPVGAQRCVMCDPGTYNWEGGSECKPCPGGARCDGGASMKAIFGNWRYNGDSTSFISCFQPDACLGAPVPEAPQTSLLDPLTNLNAELRRSYPEAVQDRNESCAPGYMGNLCAGCENGFGRTGLAKCRRCPSTLTNTFYLMTAASIALIFMIVLIQRTRKTAGREQRDVVSMLAKIAASYLQFVSLAREIDINWPSIMIDIFLYQSLVTSPSNQIVSVDCLLASLGSRRATGGIGMFYTRLLLYTLTPVAFVLFAALVWLIVWLYRRFLRRNESRSPSRLRAIMVDNFIVTVIVFLFLIYPSVCRVIFEVFTCTKLDDAFYLQKDLDTPCYDTAHKLWMIAYGVPSVVIFVLGVPMAGWYLLWNKRNRLRDHVVKEKYGFLYSGYKSKHYYWEVVVVIRKVLLICVAVFLAEFGFLVQALAAMGLAFFAYLAHVAAMPFRNEKLDVLEKCSLLMSLATFYFGSYLNSPAIEGLSAVIISILIMLANIVFVIVFIWSVRRELWSKLLSVLDQGRVCTLRVMRNKRCAPCRRACCRCATCDPERTEAPRRRHYTIADKPAMVGMIGLESRRGKGSAAAADEVEGGGGGGSGSGSAQAAAHAAVERPKSARGGVPSRRRVVMNLTAGGPGVRHSYDGNRSNGARSSGSDSRAARASAMGRAPRKLEKKKDKPAKAKGGEAGASAQRGGRSENANMTRNPVVVATAATATAPTEAATAEATNGGHGNGESVLLDVHL